LLAEGAESVDVLVSLVIIGADFDSPVSVFDSLQVTLQTMDEMGQTVAIGSSGVTITVEEPTATVSFEDVVPQHGLEAILEFDGGAVENAVLLVSGGSSLPASGSTALTSQSGAGIGNHGWGAQRIGAETRGLTPVSTMVFYRAEGKVKANKFPKIAVDLPALGVDAVDVDAGLMVMTEEFVPPGRKELPKKVVATLYAVGGNGEAEKLDSSTENTDSSGSAAFRFENVGEIEDGHLRLELQMKGRKVNNALVLAYGSPTERE